MCQETIDWFEKKCFPYALESENPARESISWLKSLKGRYAWKPSDEQVKVCKEVYADLLSAKGFDVGTINSELNRLEEKLRGEI